MREMFITKIAMMGFFKISDKAHSVLNTREMGIYAILSCKSESNISKIRRCKISEFSNIKTLKNISKYTNALQEQGLIRKNYIIDEGRKYCIYELLNLNANFTMVSNKIVDDELNLECGAIGLAIKLSNLRLNGSNWIGLSDKDIYTKVGLSKNSFKKYKDILLDKKVLYKVEDGYILNTYYFPVVISADVSKEETLSKLDDSFKGKKVFIYYKTRGYQGLKMEVNKFLDWCLAGCPGINKEPQYKQLFPKEFKFD